MSEQANINKRRNTRIVVFIVVIAVLIGAYMWFSANKDSLRRVFGGGTMNTYGFIAVVQKLDDGQNVGILKPDSTLMMAPGSTPTNVDREPVWSPDGTLLYFVSDRYQNQPHIFEWNPNGEPDRRTLDRRTKTSLTFQVPGSTEPSKTALLLQGANVITLNPSANDANTKQLLPPKNNKEGAQQTSEEGMDSNFQRAYAQIGTAFLKARWGLGGNSIIATIRNNEGGETLIVQDLSTVGQKPPEVVATGDRIDFEVNQKTGAIAFTIDAVDKQRCPVFLTVGDAKKPVRHALALVDPQAKTAMVVAMSLDDKIAFAQPALSPDGSTAAVEIGAYKGAGEVAVSYLGVVPMVQEGGRNGKSVASGEITHPQWVNDATILYVVRDSSGKHSVHEVGSTGDNDRNLTGSKGDFIDAAVSPAARPAQ